MSYVECPKCGQKALSVATQCPHCGLDFLTQPAKPIVEPETRELRPILLMGGGVLLALVLVITLAVVLWPDAESGMSPRPTATALDTSARKSSPTPRPPTPKESAPTPAATTPEAPATVTPQTQRYARRWVNVRKARRPDAAILRVLKPGEAVQADSLQAGWYRVSIGGQPVGYVYRAYLSLVEPGTVTQ